MRSRTLLPLLIGPLVAIAACEDRAPLGLADDLDIIPQQVRQGVPAEARSALFWFADGSEVEGAGAGLVRTADAIRTRTHTTGLPPRHVMTVWWVIFNHPEHCQHGQGDLACGELDLFDGPEGPTGVEPSCVYADGSVVGGNGGARFHDRIRIGEVRDSCIDFFVDAVPELQGQDHGLTNPEGAEVHLVVRSHGPLLPGQVPDQRGTFAGGCEELLGAGQGPELEPGQCSDLKFAVFPTGN